MNHLPLTIWRMKSTTKLSQSWMMASTMIASQIWARQACNINELQLDEQRRGTCPPPPRKATTEWAAHQVGHGPFELGDEKLKFGNFLGFELVSAKLLKALGNLCRPTGAEGDIVMKTITIGK